MDDCITVDYIPIPDRLIHEHILNTHYYILNNMYNLSHINYTYINSNDDYLTSLQYVNVMSFLNEIN
jgi:hypothetical protein